MAADHGSGQARRPGTVAVAVPPWATERIPWVVHRVATAGRYTDTLHTILTEWSLADVYAANAVIDALAAAEEPRHGG
jgi:hypothetical protein